MGHRKKVFRSLRALSVRALLAMFWLFVAMSAQGQNMPLGLQVALAKNMVMAGEPVILHFKLTNLSNQPLFLKMGKYRYNWFRIQVRDASGQELPVVEDHTYEPKDGFVVPKDRTLQPGESCGDSLVVGHYAAITQEGTYQVVFKANLTYQFGNVPEASRPDGALVTARALTLQASAPDKAQLQQRAEELRKHIQHWREAKKRDMERAAVAALFSMPEEVVMPSWTALLSDPKSYSGSLEAVAQLTRLGTPAAVDLLTQTAQNTRIFSDVRGAAGSGIYNIYRTSGPEMRAYLEQLYRDTYGEDSILYQITRQGEEAERQMKSREQKQVGSSQN